MYIKTNNQPPPMNGGFVVLLGGSLCSGYCGDVFSVYVGTIGHVAHGKSTVVKAISGVQVTIWVSSSSLF